MKTKSILLIFIALIAIFPLSAQEPTATNDISGNLDDGTLYKVNKPENWNGILVLDLDGASPFGGALPQWFADNDYAYGGTSRGNCGYNFPACIANLNEVRSKFIQQYGEPKWTIALGSSRGSFVARLALELHPDIYDGAMITTGGGAGSIATMNSKLDAVWALKTLVNPSAPLQLVNITNTQEENNALSALMNEALSTQEGKARLALSSAFEQFALWADRSSEKPAVIDGEEWVRQIASAYEFANPATVRQGMEEVAGGNVSWNKGVNYRQLLERSGRKKLVEELYKKAGLDLEADLAKLEETPRISADPEALARAEKLMTYTGNISAPIIVVDNDDPVDPAALKSAYAETLKNAGNSNLMRLCWVDHAGHGGQNTIERISGFVTLINRLETDKWSDTSPAAMNALAEKLLKEMNLNYGTPDFFENNPPAPLRTWDVSNWGTYIP